MIYFHLGLQMVLKLFFHSDRDGNNNIFIMNADGSDQKNLTTNKANDNTPTMSLDGNYVLFSSDRGHSKKTAESYLLDFKNGKNYKIIALEV